MSALRSYAPALCPPDEPDYDAVFERVCSDENVAKLSMRLQRHWPWISSRLAHDETFCNEVAKSIAAGFRARNPLIKTSCAEAIRLLQNAAQKYVERPNYDDGMPEPDADSIDLGDAA